MRNQKLSNAKNLIQEFLLNPCNENMHNLIVHSKNNDLDDKEIFYLAKGLADSGSQIKLNNVINICDIPSTGGPTSLSTLLCPLFLRMLGNTVVKLGVPGRPAGGIDILAQISGYKTTPSIDEVNKWISITGYVHFEASKAFAPLDSKLFQYRKEHKLLGVPSLVIASLLSKKIAVGLNHVGLDIRVSKFGNFGATWDEARQNGKRFNKVAKLAGITSKCFITNGAVPYQPYIGRGEALVAMSKIFANRVDPHLKKHIGYCYSMAKSISKESNLNSFSILQLEEEFIKNISIQGGSIDSFKKIIKAVEENHNYQILAPNEGILSIDIERIRESIVKIQNQHNSTLYPDTCGLILKAMPNEYIYKNEIICTFRCEPINKNEFENHLENSFKVIPQIESSLDFEEII